MPGLEVTATNLQPEVLPLSNSKPVVILCWSARSVESVSTLRALGNLEAADAGKWVLARVDVDTQGPVAQALPSTKHPLRRRLYRRTSDSILGASAWARHNCVKVITKILTLAAQQGIGEEPLEPTEPEEDGGTCSS